MDGEENVINEFEGLGVLVKENKKEIGLEISSMVLENRKKIESILYNRLLLGWIFDK